METEQAYEVETDQVDIQRPAPTNTEGAFKLFAQLTDAKHKLEDELAAIERQLKPLKEVLLAIWECHPGKGAHKTQGYTIYLAHTTWARSGPDRRKTVEALLALGFPYNKVVSLNGNTLSDIVREYKKNGEEVPTDLAEAIVVSEKIDVRACKS